MFWTFKQLRKKKFKLATTMFLLCLHSHSDENTRAVCRDYCAAIKHFCLETFLIKSKTGCFNGITHLMGSDLGRLYKADNHSQKRI